MCGFKIASYILVGHQEAWAEESVIWQPLSHHFIMEFRALTCLRKIPLLLPPGSDFEECLPTPASPLLLPPFAGSPCGSVTMTQICSSSSPHFLCWCPVFPDEGTFGPI